MRTTGFFEALHCAAADSPVLEIDAASGEIVAESSAGHTAMALTLAPDGKRRYVCNRFNNAVSVIDLKHRTQLARVAAVWEPVATAMTPDGGGWICVSHAGRHELSVIDAAALLST